MKLNFNVDNKIEFIKYVLDKITVAGDAIDDDDFCVIEDSAIEFLHEMEIEKLSNAEIIDILVDTEADWYFCAGFEEFFKNEKITLDIHEWLPDTCDKEVLLEAVEKYLAAEKNDDVYIEEDTSNATPIGMFSFQNLFNDVFKKS